VTGGAGYIGSHTVLELIRAGIDVTVVDNLSNSNIKSLERVLDILDPDRSNCIRIPFINADVCNTEIIRNVFMNNKFDGVIHFAGLKAVGESVRDPLSYYVNNVAGTISILSAMKEFNVKNIVFSSSATVYAEENKSPLTENMSLSTTNPYGQSKLMVENILDDLANSDTSWNVIKLRYFNPIGAHETGFIGESPDGVPNNLLPYVTQVANKTLSELNIFGDDYDTHDGTGVRDYIHVVDLAKGHLCAINKINEFPGSNAINLGTGKGYSVLDIVNQFKMETGIEVPYRIAPRRPGDLASVFSDPRKAKELLGWQAELNLQDMLRDAWKWQSNNPCGYN